MTQRLFCYLIFVLLSLSTAVNSYNILCFFPTISKSQVVFSKPLLVALARKGHNVTLVSTFSVQKNIPNYREIIIPVDLTAHSSNKCLYFVGIFTYMRNKV